MDIFDEACDSIHKSGEAGWGRAGHAMDVI